MYWRYKRKSKSQAYTSNGTQVDVNVPRYEDSKFGQGILIEERTTNLLSNPSFETGDFTDWSKYSVDGQIIITDDSLFGQYAAQLSCPLGKHQWLSRNIPTLTPGKTYTLSAWYKLQQYTAGRIGIVVYVRYTDGTEASLGITEINYTKINEWQRISKTFTVSTSKPVEYIRIYVPWSNILNGSFVSDGIQLEEKNIATSYTDSTREKETLTIPTTSVINPQEGTIEAWVYVNNAIKNTSVWRYIFGHGSDNTRNWIALRHTTDNKWEARTSNAAGQSSSVAVPDTLTVDWHYFAMRWSPTELALFIDGVKVGSVINPKLPDTLEPTAKIGSWALGDYGWVNTVIDEFRVSNRARTDQEIQSAYNSQLPVDAWTTLKLDFNGNLNAQSGQ